MKIYTSYFANIRNLQKEGIVAISIARYSPKWYYGPRYTNVAPSGWMISGQCSHEEYLKKYDEILSCLDANEVVNTIKGISQGKDVALCCYEKPGDFCHRHLLADWLNRNGFEVKEWDSKVEREKSQQLSLFD